jgi:hypothetical protein
MKILCFQAFCRIRRTGVFWLVRIVGISSEFCYMLYS